MAKDSHAFYERAASIPDQDSSSMVVDNRRAFRNGLPCLGDPEYAQNVSFTLTLVSGDASLFATQPYLDAYGTLKFEASPGRSGVTTWMIQLRDDGDNNSTSPPKLVRIVVLPVNHAPSFVLMETLSIYHDVGAHTYPQTATYISAGPYEYEQHVTFAVTVQSGSEAFLTDPVMTEDGTLLIDLRVGITVQAVLAVQLYDDGGTQNGGHHVSDEQLLIMNIIKRPSPVSNLTVEQVRCYNECPLFTVVFNSL